MTTRVALVTGGSNGIGRAVVSHMASNGYRVVVLDRTEAEAENDSSVFVSGDVAVPADNVRAVATCVERYGRLDVFVGNAGIHDGGRALTEVPADELAAVARRVFDVDVLGYLLGAHAAVGELKKAAGCMIFTLSDASFIVTRNGSGPVYTAAKHAALGLVRHLAAELAPTVRVNGVAPGGIITDLRATDGVRESQRVFADSTGITGHIRANNPLGVILTPEEIAPLYTMLAGDLGRAMTGEVLRPDGGLGVR